MAFKPGKTKVDLRTLMKKQREEKNSNLKKVESPLAKYNSLGQLTCVVCQIPIKSEIIWNAHVQGKKHRQNVEELKSSRKKMEPPGQPPAPDNKASISSSSELKRKGSLTGEQPVMKKKVPDEPAPQMKRNKGETHKKKKKKHKKHEKSPPRREHTEEPTTEESATPDSSSTPTMKEKLPEGFFDDATADAKVRKVEVKNTAAEEWEKFQKEMKQQQQASQLIKEADEEATQVARNITEIDEQIQRFANIERLRDQQDKWKTEKPAKGDGTNQESGTSDDEDEFDTLMDWTSKVV